MLPVLDLKQTLDRKTKKIECSVHCKKTHTNLNVKERSNHPDMARNSGHRNGARTRLLGNMAATLSKEMYGRN